MARIYNQAQFGGSFKSSAQSRGFAPETAIDYSKQEKAKADAANAQEKVKQRALSRQQDLDKGMLQGQQAIANATHKAEVARTNGNLALAKGLAGLSSTVANTLLDYSEKAQAEAAKQEELDQLGGWLNSGGSVVAPNGDGGVAIVPSTPEASAPSQAAIRDNQTRDIEAVGFETAASESSSDPGVQEAVRAPIADQVARNNTGKANVHVAASQVSPYLMDFMDSGTPVRLPDGRVIPANAATNALDLQAVAMAGVKQFAAENGIDPRGAQGESVVRTFIPSAQNAVVSQVNSRAAGARAASHDARVTSATEAAITGLDAGGDVGTAWQTLSTGLYTSGKYGGNRTKANDAAMEILVNELAARGDIEALEALENTPKFINPGGKPGPKLGTTYSALIETAKRRARSNVAGDRRAVADEAKADLQDAKNTFVQQLTEAQTPEQVEAAHLQYEAQLQALQTPEARAEYINQRSIPNNRNPLAYGDFMDRITSGDPTQQPSQDEINDAVRSGMISLEQGRQLSQIAGPGAADDIKAVRGQIKNITDTVAAAQITIASGIPQAALKPAQAQISADLQQRVEAQLLSALREEPGLTSSQLVQIAREYVQREAPALIKNAQWDPESQSITGYPFAGAQSTQGASTVAWVNPSTGNKGVVISGLSLPQLESLQYDNNLDNDIDAANDRVLTTADMSGALDAIQSGGTMPTRITRIAEMLDMTPQRLVVLQAQAQGLPNIEAIKRAVIGEASNPDNPNISSIEQQALDVIGKYESDGAGSYNAVNQGGSDGGNTVLGYSGHYAKLGGKDLTNLSIGEIMELQREDGRSWDSWFASGKLHAVGRYQFIGSTLTNIVRAMGISGSSKFTPELQDQMALWLLRNAGNGIGQWVGPNNYATAAERDVVNQARNNVIAANRILRNPNRTAAQTRRAVRDISTAGGLFA